MAILLIGSFAPKAYHAYRYKQVMNKAATAYLKGQIQDQLIDPDSALFRNVHFYPPVHNAHGHYALCGELNAKNRMGGYTGYTPFLSVMYVDMDLNPNSWGALIYDPDHDRVESIGPAYGNFRELTASYCKDE